MIAEVVLLLEPPPTRRAFVLAFELVHMIFEVAGSAELLVAYGTKDRALSSPRGRLRGKLFGGSCLS